MSVEVDRFAAEYQAGATMLMGGFITSSLLILAASVLWTGFLFAAALGSFHTQDPDGGAIAVGVITVLNAALFYVWGLSGLRKCAKAQKAALATKRSPEV
jgi:hypothetical protein